jgi:hypothetical protein
VAYPYADLERATAALRGELRRVAAAAGKMPDWATLTIEGPAEAAGTHGRTWYVWAATVGTVARSATSTAPGDHL